MAILDEEFWTCTGSGTSPWFVSSLEVQHLRRVWSQSSGYSLCKGVKGEQNSQDRAREESGIND